MPSRACELEMCPEVVAGVLEMRYCLLKVSKKTSTTRVSRHISTAISQTQCDKTPLEIPYGFNENRPKSVYKYPRHTLTRTVHILFFRIFFSAEG